MCAQISGCLKTDVSYPRSIPRLSLESCVLVLFHFESSNMKFIELYVFMKVFERCQIKLVT